MLTLLIVILLVFLLIGALPTYPYSRSWGYGPAGGLLVVVLVVVLILVLTGSLNVDIRGN